MVANNIHQEPDGSNDHVGDKLGPSSVLSSGRHCQTGPQGEHPKRLPMEKTGFARTNSFASLPGFAQDSQSLVGLPTLPSCPPLAFPRDSATYPGQKKPHPSAIGTQLPPFSFPGSASASAPSPATTSSYARSPGDMFSSSNPHSPVHHQQPLAYPHPSRSAMHGDSTTDIFVPATAPRKRSRSHEGYYYQNGDSDDAQGEEDSSAILPAPKARRLKIKAAAVPEMEGRGDSSAPDRPQSGSPRSEGTGNPQTASNEDGKPKSKSTRGSRACTVVRFPSSNRADSQS
jgi:hypothetical protein